MIRGLGLLNRTCFHLNCGSHAPSIRLIVLLHPVIVRSLALPSGLRSVSHKSNISLDCVVLIPRLWANIQCLSDPSLSLFLTHIFTSVRRRPRSWRRYELHGFPVGSQHHIFHGLAQRTTYPSTPVLSFLASYSSGSALLDGDAVSEAAGGGEAHQAKVLARTTRASRSSRQLHRDLLGTDVSGGLRILGESNSSTNGDEPLTRSPFFVTLAATKLLPTPVASTWAVTCLEPSCPLYWDPAK